MLGEDGAGECPHCGCLVTGQRGTAISYWHPVEDCRANLAQKVADIQAFLKHAMAEASRRDGAP